MGIYTMENGKLKVTVADYGAELVNIFDKANQRELIWQADPAFWNRHAPVLFPNVGKYYGGNFSYDGKEYPEGQHGFARDMALESKDFPNFGIWSKPGAPYVCLEPWCGRCDNRGFEGDISEKPGIIALEPGETFEKSYDIIVY